MTLFLFALWCAVLSFYDLRWRRLPNFLTLPGAAVINVTAAVQDPLWIAGGLVWAGLYFITALVVGGIGGGDIKFALGLGTVVASAGLGALMLAIVGSSLLSVLLGGMVRVYSRHPGRLYIPHGPSMALASTCAFIVFEGIN
ncbi:prepilin peptidase [Corynebacterium callunae]|uniref:prepilin peptidase n=1 Tax=Corynebacterium callunae TaxID=1721 RepID=UPI0039823216